MGVGSWIARYDPVVGRSGHHFVEVEDVLVHEVDEELLLVLGVRLHQLVSVVLEERLLEIGERHFGLPSEVAVPEVIAQTCEKGFLY